MLLVLLTLTFTAALNAQVEVYTPSLKSPANQAVDQLPDTYVSWYAIAGSLGLQYRVQIDTTPAFNSPLLKDTTLTLLTGYKTRLLLFGVKYFWRVQAIDLGQTSYWSEVWDFTVFNQVSHSKPNNNATAQAPNVSIEWKNTLPGSSVVITGIDHYDYQIDADTNFNSPSLITGSTVSSVLKAATANLVFGQKYFWRVRARHNAGHTAWSQPWNFTVTNTIELDKPADNATDQMLNVPLKWKNPGGFLAFNYEIALDPQFQNLILLKETDTLQVNAEWLMFGIKYYWRVRGRHIHDTTEWSATRSFTTINTVALKTPANAALNINVIPTFTWTAQTGVDGFQIQVADAPNFSSPYIDATAAGNEASYKALKKLKNNTMYYWRMRAMSNGGTFADTTDWSPVWNFTTTAATGIGEDDTRTLMIYPNPARSFVHISIEYDGPTEAGYTLIDLVGKTVLDGRLSLTSGSNLRTISLEGLKKGYYILRIQINGSNLNHKLIIE